MDNKISKMFEQKNARLLVSNLKLDIERNASALRLIISNRTRLDAIKLQKRLNDFFRDNSIEYDLKSLSELVEELRKDIDEYMLSEIEKREEQFKTPFEQDEKESQTDIDSVIKELMYVIESETREDIHSKFNSTINDKVYVEFLNKLVEMYKLSDAQREQVIERCLKKYDFDLSSNVEDWILVKNMSLKNSMTETIERVNELNLVTTSEKFNKNVSTVKKV